KLMAQIDTPRQAIIVFQSNLEQNPGSNAAAQHYGLARALMRNHDLDGAAVQLDWLRANAPQHPMVETLAADIARARGDGQEAARIYAEALAVFPSHRALIYGHAEHFIATHQFDKALRL